ncbi:MAG: hypothetical protein ACLSVD_12515 [Eggerthellaceae bacterium]
MPVLLASLGRRGDALAPRARRGARCARSARGGRRLVGRGSLGAVRRRAPHRRSGRARAARAPRAGNRTGPRSTAARWIRRRGVVDVPRAPGPRGAAQQLAAGGKRACAAGLSLAERAVVAALGRYASLLRDASPRETSQACAAPLRPRRGAAHRPRRNGRPGSGPRAPVRRAGRPLRRHVRFDDGCRRADPAEPRAAELRSLLDRLFSSQGDAVEPTGAVRFLLPAGRYAAPRLVSRAVADLVARERERAREEGRPVLPVAVAARDPRAMFGDVADDLLQRGATAAVSARRRFADTAFGRSSSHCSRSRSTVVPHLPGVDFALSASPASRGAACELDAS